MKQPGKIESNKTEKYCISDNSAFFHLCNLGAIIKEGIDSFEMIAVDTKFDETNPKLDTSINRVFQTQLLIWVESFMDEWNKYFTNKNYPSKRVQEFKKCVKPYTDIIVNYSHSRRLRNTVLAHAFRDDKGKSVFFQTDYGLKNSPKNIVDVLKVSRCISFISQELFRVYFDEFSEFSRQIAPVTHNSFKVIDHITESANTNEILARAKLDSTTNLDHSFPDRKIDINLA